jgi:hypothetical protein
LVFDNASANLLVELLEMSGDRLQLRLHELGMLTDPAREPVNLKRLDELLDYEIVILGGRATHADAPHPAMLCSCRRFSRGYTCAHKVFAQTLNIQGFCDAVLTDLGTRGLGFS